VARIVAIGDLHGDVTAARAALKLAGAIDDQDRWVGADLVVVQTGDQLDRGDEDRAVFDLFQRLADEAPETGGQVLSLLGNHETMNAEGWMDYVTAGGFLAFEGMAGLDLGAPWLAAFPEQERPRRAAFTPGGPYARLLATRDVVVQIGDTVFAHGSVAPDHVRYGLARINEETRQWLLNKAPQPMHTISSQYGPVWSYLFSSTTLGSDACTSLGQVLDALGAERMVVGHVVQLDGINSACEGRVWRIDVGMSRFYTGGAVQLLEIAGGKTQVLEPR
jgi:hypothetical protein